MEGGVEYSLSVCQLQRHQTIMVVCTLMYIERGGQRCPLSVLLHPLVLHVEQFEKIWSAFVLPGWLSGDRGEPSGGWELGTSKRKLGKGQGEICGEKENNLIIFIHGQRDVKTLSVALVVFERASSGYKGSHMGWARLRNKGSLTTQKLVVEN